MAEHQDMPVTVSRADDDDVDDDDDFDVGDGDDQNCFFLLDDESSCINKYIV